MADDCTVDRFPMGTYNRALDQKFRMTIPGVWREPPIFINDTAYLTFRRPARMVLLPHDFIYRISKRKFKAETVKEKASIKEILQTVTTVLIDQRGRITIPHELVQVLDLKPNEAMVVTASGGWVEIWAQKEWDKGKAPGRLFNP